MQCIKEYKKQTVCNETELMIIYTVMDIMFPNACIVQLNKS